MSVESAEQDVIRFEKLVYERELGEAREMAAYGNLDLSGRMCGRFHFHPLMALVTVSNHSRMNESLQRDVQDLMRVVIERCGANPNDRIGRMSSQTLMEESRDPVLKQVMHKALQKREREEAIRGNKHRDGILASWKWHHNNGVFEMV